MTKITPSFLGTIFLFGQSPARIGPSQYQRPMVLRDAGSVLSTQQRFSRRGQQSRGEVPLDTYPVFVREGAAVETTLKDILERY